MKLKVLDQILVSSVDSDTLRPGREIDVSDEVGARLLAAHPATFEEIGEKAEKAPPKARKAAPSNKARAPKGKK